MKTIILIVFFVINGNLDFSYRIQPSLEVCEIRRDAVIDYVYLYGNNVEHIEAHCVTLGED